MFLFSFLTDASGWSRGPRSPTPHWTLTDGPKSGIVNTSISGFPRLDHGIKAMEPMNCHIIKQVWTQLMVSVGLIKPVEAINHVLDGLLMQQSPGQIWEAINYHISKQPR